MVLNAGANTIGGSAAGAGNVISDNTTFGVQLSGLGADGDVVEGDLIGTDATGSVAEPNGQDGVELDSEALNNTIGGVTSTPGTGAGDIISGNSGAGVLLTGTATINNVIEGDLIGTNAAGTAAIPNVDGVVIVAGAMETEIGGVSAGEGDVISGNTAEGISISGTADVGSLIQGDDIGTDSSGISPLGNGDCGIVIGNSDNQVGGSSPGSGNVIGSNTNAGVSISGTGATLNLVIGNDIGTDSSGNDLGNGIGVADGIGGNSIGGTGAGEGNVIGFNTSAGISLSGSIAGDVVLGNLIGVDGLINEANPVGVFVSSAFNTIGGSDAGAGNVIGFNTSAGVSISGQGAFGNLLLGNDIGTDSNHDNLGNPVGVVVETENNTIGGTAAGAGNTIGFNASAGVSISGQFAFANVLLGNDIGADAGGDNLANSIGVVVHSADNTIGGTAADAGNLIFENTSAGVSISGASAMANLLLGDVIEYNDVGVIIDSADNTIGGTASGAANVLGYNTGAGVSISGLGSTGNLVLGNFIGTDSNGDNLGDPIGVVVETGQNTIGGTAADAANIIGFNTAAGVSISGLGRHGEPGARQLHRHRFQGRRPGQCRRHDRRVGGQHNWRGRRHAEFRPRLQRPADSLGDRERTQWARLNGGRPPNRRAAQGPGHHRIAGHHRPVGFRAHRSPGRARRSPGHAVLRP